MQINGLNGLNHGYMPGNLYKYSILKIMKKEKGILLICSILLGLSVNAKNPEGYSLVWHDEFNGNALDSTVWSNEPANPRWVNNELQRYTDGNNASVVNGVLRIEARHENGEYTSGRVNTRSKKTFTYGIVEFRAKLPEGEGTWPALWLLGQNEKEIGWPDCGELDVMEHVGKHPNYIHTSIHNRSGYGQTPYTGILKIKDPFHKFHIYGMEWTKDYIAFYVDHKLSYKYQPQIKTIENWPFDKPFYLICNLAIGGDWGGPNVDNACFPARMDVDWIRVYQKN